MQNLIWINDELKYPAAIKESINLRSFKDIQESSVSQSYTTLILS